MRKRTTARYNCFKNIRAFGTTHEDHFPATSFAGGLFAQMGQVVTRLESLSATQTASTGGSIQGTTSKSAIRKNLEDLLDSITRAAEAMSHHIPGIEDKFGRPRRKRDSVLLSTARAFLSEATPHKTEFINFGLSATFLEDLQAQITEFEEAVNDRSIRLQTRSSAIADIKDAIERGLMLREQLDAVVRNSASHDPGVLGAWETAHHIEQAPRKRSRKAAAPVSDTPADEEPKTGAP